MSGGLRLDQATYKVLTLRKCLPCILYHYILFYACPTFLRMPWGYFVSDNCKLLTIFQSVMLNSNTVNQWKLFTFKIKPINQYTINIRNFYHKKKTLVVW